MSTAHTLVSPRSLACCPIPSHRPYTGSRSSQTSDSVSPTESPAKYRLQLNKKQKSIRKWLVRNHLEAPYSLRRHTARHNLEKPSLALNSPRVKRRVTRPRLHPVGCTLERVFGAMTWALDSTFCISDLIFEIFGY